MAMLRGIGWRGEMNNSAGGELSVAWGGITGGYIKIEA
jgi:hypothetical protein